MLDFLSASNLHMVRYLTLALGGIFGGVLGGMGMGGGTLLIPILTIFFNFEQITAQGINLISFIPMAVITLFLHVKNKLVNLKGLLILMISAVVSSAGASFLAQKLKGDLQTKLFGVFLILLAIIKFIMTLKMNKSENNKK